MKKFTVSGKNYYWLQINLQQGLILSESGYSILACYVKHSNKVFYNKPLVKLPELRILINWMDERNFINGIPDVIKTDSFSIGGWNPKTSTTELFN